MRFLTILLTFAALLPAIDVPRVEAPQFQARALDGTSYNNASVKGRVVLIQFWTTWCRYCRADQPSVEALVDKYDENRLLVLAVSVNESKKKVRDYLAGSPRKSKIIAAEDTNLPAVFEISGFPCYVLLDQKGRIAAKLEGAAGTELERALKHAGLDQ